jgi:hypothetical protein
LADLCNISKPQLEPQLVDYYNSKSNVHPYWLMGPGEIHSILPYPDLSSMVTCLHDD